MKVKKLVITLLLLLLIAGTIDMVHAGISITITEGEIVVENPGETANYVVTLESITTEDENFQLSIVAHGDLKMNWNFTEGVIETGATEDFWLVAEYVGTATGNLAFTVFGEAWPVSYNYSQAIELGLLETSSYTDYVYVPYAEPEPAPSPTPTSGSTTTPTPTPTTSSSSSTPTPSPNPTPSPSPTPTVSQSPSPSPPPEEAPTLIYVAIGIGAVVAIAAVIAFLRIRK